MYNKKLNKLKKTKGLEPGLIYAPYIIIGCSLPYDVVGSPGFSGATLGISKRDLRKKKIDKIFNNIPYIDDEFKPSKSLYSRYSTKKTISSKYYQTIVIPTSQKL